MAIPSKNYKNILIVKLSAIGDVIHALPVAHALKQRYPEAHLTWVVEKPAYDLLINNPDIDEIIIFDKPKFKSVAGLIKNMPQLYKNLTRHRFDLAIDLQGLLKSSLIIAMSGATKNLGYCNMRELSHLISEPVCGANSQGHVVDRYLDVAKFLGCDTKRVIFPIHFTAIEISQTEFIAKEIGFNMDRPYVVLAPGTNWTTKCWPIRRFIELVDKLLKKEIQVVIVGGPGDNHLSIEIQNQFYSDAFLFNITGQTSLKQLAYVIKKGAVFIGGDTGPMHLAVAVGTPVVALFGPTDPKRNGPYQGENVVIQPNRSCINCWRRECDIACLDEIEADTVLREIEKLLKKVNKFY